MNMKKLSLAVVASMAFLSFQACTDNTTDPIESANETNEMKSDSVSMVSEEGSNFAVEAASGGMMEVQLGELAQQKGSSQQVKDFGAMMVRDHSKANEELKSLAGQHNITLPPAPGEDHMEHINKLSQKSGKEFDKEYIDMMVKDHKEDVDAFEKASNNTNDPDIQAFASRTLPVLRQHLEAAQAIKDAMK